MLNRNFGKLVLARKELWINNGRAQNGKECA